MPLARTMEMLVLMPPLAAVEGLEEREVTEEVLLRGPMEATEVLEVSRAEAEAEAVLLPITRQLLAGLAVLEQGVK